jgi:Cu+-exporting ATPase
MNVTDPVCRMNIEVTNAFDKTAYKDTTYYFCSESCRDKFSKNPVDYLTEKPAGLKEIPVSGDIYTCPMHPEVQQIGPGSCPMCGMALEPLTPVMPSFKTEWTCPMHPEIVQDTPGNCPICGMALEPKVISAEEEENPELVDMTRRFKVGAVLSIPLVIIAMGGLIPGISSLFGTIPHGITKWLELLLATPVVLWGGWPFFVRGWQSVINRSPNMFTLIGLGTGMAYCFSVIAALLPGIFPESFRDESGAVGLYFEAAAVIVTLVLLGQVLELRARHKTGAAIKALLGLAPKTARRISDEKEEVKKSLSTVLLWKEQVL